LLADDAREVRRTESGVERPDAWPDLAEARRVGGNRQVADHVEDVSAADRKPVDRRDDGLRDVADQTVQRLDLEDAGLRRSVVARLRPLLLVPPGAEGLVSGAGEDHDADAAVRPGGLHAVDELVDRLAAERVVALGTVDRDRGYPFGGLVEHVGEFHAVQGNQARTANRRQRPGTPFRSCSPRSSNSRPEPATRSV